MITFNRRTKVFVCKEPADMRASYDTLFSKAKGVLNQDSFSGHLFLFINARRTSIKCLYYDGTGLVIIAKRLEKGFFSRINPFYKGEVVLTAAEFALFFEGADLEKRFVESPAEIKKSAFAAAGAALNSSEYFGAPILSTSPIAPLVLRFGGGDIYP